MGKKITLGIFGFITLVGLVLMIVGYALGGWPGSFSVSDGRIVYTAGGEEVEVGKAPHWWRASWYNGDYLPNWDGEAYDLDAPAAAEIQKVSVNVSAGYVNVTTGDVARVTIDGPLKCTSSFSNGEWTIESQYSNFRVLGNPTRFWLGDVDVTTTYTIVLPKELAEAEIHVDMGKLEVTGVSADELELSTDMGEMIATGLSAKEAEFSTDMGSIDIAGFTGATCSLTVNMGGITFAGSVTDTLTADCDMGSIEITTPRPQNYSWQAQADLGAITIDGQTRSGFSSQANGGEEGTKPYFDLKCGMGSINVTFA